MNSARLPVTRWPAGETGTADSTDNLAIEEPMEIRVSGRSVAVTMRTPGHDRELAAGFLLTEGLIRQASDVLDILMCRDLPEGQTGNVVDALLAPDVAVDFARLTRHVFSSSSCGLCGKATIDAVAHNFLPAASGPQFTPAFLATLPGRLRAAQPGFAATGGLHASALFNSAGELLCLREDVGRHNALDKVLGWALLESRLPLRDTVLLVSGRVSFELVQKTLAAGLPLIAGIGAPSTLAVECARRGNLTLVGFLRAERFNVYCGAERVRGA
ncbi:formate dehydrogenase accessory sulfurtransferase FdhD [Opitutus sp. GAS368]|uniref:formate dehydrogenase accessory sulfurtransferase FdhD n=1 Tax=Opitutus sp. GAS368 TaxID=1882749 RepID=UPI00087DEC43|nr:formate dehydrogenase accessory sulfurtransferase FdhD [Opitutus sp. GAS368]SDS17959.1 FdhD protein [Opitutus sp. GAS368]